jgi:hypothetical protein
MTESGLSFGVQSMVINGILNVGGAIMMSGLDLAIDEMGRKSRRSANPPAQSKTPQVSPSSPTPNPPEPPFSSKIGLALTLGAGGGFLGEVGDQLGKRKFNPLCLAMGAQAGAVFGVGSALAAASAPFWVGVVIAPLGGVLASGFASSTFC